MFVENNQLFVQTLRLEIENERSLYDERRHQNCDLNVEIDKNRSGIKF
jgi:hypothetical protein